jgi:hypothetical protein
MTQNEPGARSAMKTKWIGCDFDDQGEDSIQDTPEKAAIEEAAMLMGERCEKYFSDLRDGLKIEVRELECILCTEANREQWESIDGAEWFTVGQSDFYMPTGRTMEFSITLNVLSTEPMAEWRKP